MSQERSRFPSLDRTQREGSKRTLGVWVTIKWEDNLASSNPTPTICYCTFASIGGRIWTARLNALRLDFTVPSLGPSNESFPRYRYGIFGYVPVCTWTKIDKNRKIQGNQPFALTLRTYVRSSGRRAFGSTALVVYFRHCLSLTGHLILAPYTSFARRRWFSHVPTLLDRCTQRPRAFPRPTTTDTYPVWSTTYAITITVRC